MTKSTNLLEEFISEVLGKFSLNKFMAISNTNFRRQQEPRVWKQEDDYKLGHPEVVYATNTLPKLGQGSSRVTFAYSGDKVLKIAMNNAGIEQNRNEVQAFQQAESGGFADIVTKVYNWDKNSFKWVIEELVKPFDNDKDVYVSLGLTRSLFADLLRNSYDISVSSSQAIEQMIKWYENYVKDIDNEIAFERSLGRKQIPAIIKDAMRRKKKLEGAIKLLTRLSSNQKVLSLLDQMEKYMKVTGSPVADVAATGHWGRNLQGDVKLLDYGLADDTMDKFYEE